MTVEYKILFNAAVPEAFESALGSFVSTAQTSAENYIFTHGGENENLYFSQVDWNKVKQPEFAFLNLPILKSEVARLIIRRAAENIGALNIDDLKDDLIEKSYTVKILNEYSLGHISDIVLNFAAERKIGTVLIRPYVINLLNFLTSLANSDVITFPIDLDCGFSNDTFFIQAHCHNNEFVFENILDTLRNGPVGSISGQFEDILKYTDLLNIFTIGTSKKLVFTGCWFSQGIWDQQQKSYPSLIIHDVPSLKLGFEDLDNSVNTFIKQSLENISKIKRSEVSLAQKYKIKRDDEIVEAINPVKIKRLYNLLKDKVEIPVEDNFNIEDLEKMLDSYQDESKGPFIVSCDSVNKEEKKELLKLLKNNHSYEELDSDVQRVKGQILKEDYISEMIKNISDMSAEDAKMAFDSNDDIDEARRVSGTKEDLTEADTRISGAKEAQDGHQLVRGAVEEDDECGEVIRGSAEQISEGTIKVKSLASDKGVSQEEIVARVKASNSSERNNSEVVRFLKDDSVVRNNEVWELKRQNVINKMKTEFENTENLTPEQVNEKIESIIQSELGVEVRKSKHFVENCSDDIAEHWVAQGVNSINDEITQRLKIDKIEAKLLNRDKQVGKMKELITKLKIENGNLNSHFLDLEKENKVTNFKLRNGDEELTTFSLSADETSLGGKDSYGVDKKYNETEDENERLKKVIEAHLVDFDKVKNEKRDTELLLEKKNKELEVKNELIAKYAAERDRTKEIQTADEINSLNETVKQLHQENKDSILKAKGFELKLKYAAVQLEQYKKQEKQVRGGKGGAGVTNLQVKSQLKNLEIMQGKQEKMAQVLGKVNKELAQKKTELHKSKLENKMMSAKLRDLEKKLDIRGRKAS